MNEYHEGLYRKVLGIMQSSKKRPLMIYPSTTVKITCHDEVLYEETRATFDKMTVNEIVATWDTKDDNEKDNGKTRAGQP